MEGSELLVNTTFADARKGYDKAQVDEFLRALGEKWRELEGLLRQATQRAEDAEGRARAAEDRHHETALALADAQRRTSELGAALDSAQSELHRDEVQVATGVLAMAKRTADDAVADAEQRARQLVDDAEVRASVTVLEAEQRAERLSHEADAEIEALRRARLSDLEGDVAHLTGRREALTAEVADIQAYVDGQRRRLRAAIDEIGRALAEDGPLALDEHGVLSTLPVRVRPGASDAGAVDEGAESPGPELLIDASGGGPDTLPVDVVDDQAVAGFADGSAAGDDDGTPGEPEEPGEELDAVPGDWRASSIPDLLEGPGEPVIDLSDAVPPREPALGDSADLAVDAMRWSTDDDDDRLDDGEVSPLGAARPDADAAMDEFFDQEPAGRRRGRRRR
jgi:DivIVA domain-containing protein